MKKKYIMIICGLLVVAIIFEKTKVFCNAMETTEDLIIKERNISEEELVATEEKKNDDQNDDDILESDEEEKVDVKESAEDKEENDDDKESAGDKEENDDVKENEGTKEENDNVLETEEEDEKKDDDLEIIDEEKDDSLEKKETSRIEKIDENQSYEKMTVLEIRKEIELELKDELKEGDFAEGLHYCYTKEEGKLVISGNGSMEDSYTSIAEMPWCIFFDEIESIEISGEIRARLWQISKKSAILSGHLGNIEETINEMIDKKMPKYEAFQRKEEKSDISKEEIDNDFERDKSKEPLENDTKEEYIEAKPEIYDEEAKEKEVEVEENDDTKEEIVDEEE